MRRKKLRGSYTIEAAIYIPFVILLMLQSLGISIDYWQTSRERVIHETTYQLDTVKAFYMYQMMGEIREEIDDGAT